MKKVGLTMLALFCMAAISHAQVGIGTDNPAPSASLELNSNTKGLLINRVTEAQRVAITSPATGLLVYQTDVQAGFWYYDGARWIEISYIDTQGSITHNYGVMSTYANGTANTATGQSGIWVRYDFSTTLGSLITTESGCVDVTAGNNSRIEVGQNGVYNVLVSISLYNASSNDAVNFTVFKNGIPQNYLSSRFSVPNGEDSYGAATISSIIPMNANDYLELWFKQLATGVDRTFTIGTIPFTVVRID
jgi:hypothetical protein